MFYVLIGCNVIMITALFLNLNHLPPQIPLFFSKSWGEDQLVDSWMIIMLPILMNILYIGNLALYRKFFSGNEFVKKITYYLNIFLMTTVTLVFIKIIQLVA